MLPAVDRVQPDQRFEQHGLARSALADDQVRHAGARTSAEMSFEHDPPVEGFYDVFGSDHVMSSRTWVRIRLKIRITMLLTTTAFVLARPTSSELPSA